MWTQSIAFVRGLILYTASRTYIRVFELPFLLILPPLLLCHAHHRENAPKWLLASLLDCAKLWYLEIAPNIVSSNFVA